MRLALPKLPGLMPQATMLAFSLSLAAFVAGVLLDLPGLALGMLLSTPLVGAVVALGWRVGALLAPLLLVLAWGSMGAEERAGPTAVTVLWSGAAAAGLATVTGLSLHRSWRNSDQRLREHAQRTRLLTEAALVLQQIDEPEELYRTLPRMLSDILDFTHAEIFIPDGDELLLASTYRWDAASGFRLPLTSVSGEAFRTRTLQYVPDTRKHPNFVTAPNASITLSELAIPLLVEGEPVAVLNIEHAEPQAFGSEEQRTLTAFARMAEEALERQRVLERLERSLITDALTGLGNREGFNRQLRLELARAHRYCHRVNLVMIDLDGFKRINDELGHTLGDRALIEAGRAMDSERRESDTLFRWGGDEFAVLLPEVGRDEAMVAAERYVTAIGRISIEGRGLSASYGIASFPDDGRDAHSLLQRADDLMYQHKHA